MTQGITCRSCGSTALEPVLDLGQTPLANRLLAADQLMESEPNYSLEVVLCTGCSLLQITETIPPEILFRDYVYFSSFSDTMLRHAEQLAGRLTAARNLGPDCLVVEAASNDGYLLQYFDRGGIPVLGIEPATNLAGVAREKGIATVNEFFGSRVAGSLVDNGQIADVFLANNVLAHVADLNDFVDGIHILLADDGIAVLEVPYLKNLLDSLEFDTIYHEHLCYFSLTALDVLFRRHDLLITDVERISIHGGSLRIFVEPNPHRDRPRAQGHSVTTLLHEEEGWVNDGGYYARFADKVRVLREELGGLITTLKSTGARIAVYGASAKGCTLLNYCGLGSDSLDFAADRSVVKQGYFTPGTHIPIVGPAALLEQMPEYVLLLTWNFQEEILAQQAEYRKRGGKFIIPIPTPAIL